MEPAGLPPRVVGTGPKDLAGKSNRPNDPLRRDHPHAAQAPRARPGREGLHPDRAPGRHSDHRHPRRDRSARVPQPALQGAGHRGQVGRPHRADRARDVVHGRADLRATDGAAGTLVEHRAGSTTASPRPARRDRARRSIPTSSTVTQAKTGSTFIVTKAANGSVTRTCTTRGQQGLPHRRHLVVDQLQQNAHIEAGPPGPASSFKTVVQRTLDTGAKGGAAVPISGVPEPKVLKANRP